VRVVHTVFFHLCGIYEKLQVHSTSEAVAGALRTARSQSPGTYYQKPDRKGGQDLL